ncbi:MAG: hypothetical protein FJ148_12985 [Deltaproteobacteria bacterium]|nr:hypothetical protein [Deltaproteobacteria bacterium]
MRRHHLAAMTVLLLAGTAYGSLHDTGTVGAARARSAALAARHLPKAPPPNVRLFSSAPLDPARCNYEYVDLHGPWVVRTELRLTCPMHR